jgi:hypothetical protein
MLCRAVRPYVDPIDPKEIIRASSLPLDEFDHGFSLLFLEFLANILDGIGPFGGNRERN